MPSARGSATGELTTVIRASAVGGLGTFATEPILRGAVIRALTGEVVTEAELDARIRAGVERMDDSLRVGADAYLDLDLESLCLNHGCDPVAGVRAQAEVFALRDIHPGEEITFDYATTVAPLPGADDTPYPETEWRMEGCRCGSPHCRGTIGDVLTIPPAALRRYRELGALPDLVAAFLEQHATAPHR
jgi:SET domain-containing protein